MSYDDDFTALKRVCGAFWAPVWVCAPPRVSGRYVHTLHPITSPISQKLGWHGTTEQDRRSSISSVLVYWPSVSVTARRGKPSGARSPPVGSLLFCLGRFLHQVKMAARRRSEAGFIGSHGLFLSRQVEQERLHEALDAAFAAGGCVVGSTPVEQPLMGIQIKQGQLR